MNSRGEDNRYFNTPDKKNLDSTESKVLSELIEVLIEPETFDKNESSAFNREINDEEELAIEKRDEESFFSDKEDFNNLSLKENKPINSPPEKLVTDTKITSQKSEMYSKLQEVRVSCDRISEENNSQFSKSEDLLIDDWIRKKEEQIDYLASSLNSLIPLTVELLSLKVDESRDSIVKAIVPIIDRVLEEGSLENSEGLAQAISRILPQAISKEIESDPESIAKSLAPEMGKAIEEQIKIDKNAISKALASEMGKAIKAQVEKESDAMVEALYPVIGNTIKKYLAEEIKRINQQVEQKLSPEVIYRKIRAKIQGISEAELIVRESIGGYRVQAIFLIQKDSGLVIQEIQPSNTKEPLEADLVAGMLTAIRSFANDCIKSGSELDKIKLDEVDYGNFEILLEAAGYYYLAIVVDGEPDLEFRDRIRNTLSKIAIKDGKVLEEYNGDLTTVPDSVKVELEKLAAITTKASKEKKSSKTLLWLIGIVLSLIFIPFSIINYRGAVASRIEKNAAIELDANPELSVYRIIPQVSHGKLILEGRVSDRYLRNLAEESLSDLANTEKITINNKIIAVKVPPNKTIIAAEIARVRDIFNQQPNIKISTNYQNEIVTISGFVLEEAQINNITTAITAIPGVDRIICTVEKKLPTINTRIYFQPDSSKFRFINYETKIELVKQFLDRHPLMNLKIIATRDRYKNTRFDPQLPRLRGKIIYEKLIAVGVEPHRLKIDPEFKTINNVTLDPALWSSNYVQFEGYLDPNKPN